MEEGIAEFLPYYPDRKDKKLSYELAKKKEFNELQLGPYVEKDHKPGTPFQHQKLNARFISPHTDYDKLLVFYDPGLGKCVLPNTKISTSMGDIPIENLWNTYRSNDTIIDSLGEWSELETTIMVYCYNEKGRKVMLRPIDRFYRQFIYENIIQLKFENGIKLSLTKAHKLFNGKSWTNRYHKGCELYDKNLKPVKVSSIKLKKYRGYVYDLEVAEYHNYIANNMISHNTCLGSYIIEQFKKENVNEENRKPAIVLVPSPGIKKVWEYEIANVCTSGIYLPKIEEGKVIDKDREKLEKSRAKKIMKKSYHIESYGTFVNSLPTDPNLIKKEYSNRIIIMDEAHTVKIKSGKKGKKGKNTKYNKMYNFLHNIENSRVVMLTATPIWDKTYEIAALMNLILPTEDKLLTRLRFMNKYFNEDGTLKKGSTYNHLKNLFRGRVSYLRIKLEANMNYIGVTKPWLRFIKVFPSAMSQIQNEAANEAKKHIKLKESYITKDGVVVKYKFDWANNEFFRDENNELIEDPSGLAFKIYHEIEGGTMLDVARQAAILALPNIKDNKIIGVISDENILKKYVKFDGKSKYKFGNTPQDNILKKALGPGRLYEYSSKYAAIIDMIKNKPEENVFIYNRFVTGIGGVLVFGMILQLHGFQWVTSPEEMKNASSTKRFMIITNETGTTEDHARLLESFNKPDNAYGQRCQIVIGSRKISLGLTIKNVRQMHNISPWWNISSTVQVIGRIYRLGTHDNLKPEERYVNVYNHVAVEESQDEDDSYNENKGYPPDTSFSKQETIDIYIYKIGEQKEYANSEIHRFMKKIAWDCPLAYRRNVLVDDKDFSRECDYRECDYDCDGIPKMNYDGRINKMSEIVLKNTCKRNEISIKGKTISDLKTELAHAWKYKIPNNHLDYTNYDLFYTSEEAEDILNELVKLFKSYFTLSLENIMKLLPLEESKKPTLLKALNRIIESKTIIQNKYGFKSYLQEQNNVYFLINTIRETSNYSESLYTSLPVVTEKLTLEEVVKGIIFKDDYEILMKFCVNPKSNYTLLKDLHCQTKIILIEKIYDLKYKEENGQKLTKREKEAVEIIMKYYGYLLKVIDEDVVHTLYQSNQFSQNCDVSNKALKVIGKTRIYDKTLKKWVFMTDHEKEDLYISKIKKSKKEESLDEFEGNPYDVYAFEEIDKKGNKMFMIRRKPPPGKTQKGRNCSTILKQNLIELFFQIDYYPRGTIVDSKKVCIKRIHSSDMYNKLLQLKVPVDIESLDTYSERKVQGIYNIMTASRQEMCSLLQKWFKTHEDNNGRPLFHN